MLRFNRLIDSQQPAWATLTLSYDQRVKSRQRVTLDNDQDAGLFLPRGLVLQQGDCLQAESGEIVEVLAAVESVSTLYSDDALLLARACYHLGNRHVPLQIAPKFIRYQHDHVLDDMVHGLGLEVTFEQAPFEPESGAYAHAAHSHNSIWMTSI